MRLAAWLSIAALWLPLQAVAGADPGEAGAQIYRHGITGSGRPVQATRDGGAAASGMAAACVNCHQRSGFGGREGRSSIPPIAGRYLFGSASAGADRAIPYVEGMRMDRPPYTDETLARAIRDGVDAQGRALSYLMPNYALDADDMAALIDYLKHLGPQKTPGVTDTTLHFATIVTPDADPVKRRGMLDVLQQFFADRNARQMTPAPRMESSGKTAFSRGMAMVHRRWELHVWELSGPAATWAAQLERRLASEPVFAAISGLGGPNWAPVHEFCERAQLPCLFPNVELPVDRPEDFHSLYFSRGLLLESDLMADAIAHEVAREAAAGAPARIRQVYRAGDSGEIAAAALSAALEKRHVGVEVIGRAVPASASPQALVDAVDDAASTDALVLWLRPGDLAALGSVRRLPATVYASGLMGGLEQSPLPSQWRDRTRLAYPFDLPERRRVRVDFARGWFSIRHIPVVAEQVQVDTYLACGLLSETLGHMADTFVRDYLVERTQTQLEHRIVTGYYPHLALASDQRFASKGGYVVEWTDPAGTHIRPQGGWTIP